MVQEVAGTMSLSRKEGNKSSVQEEGWPCIGARSCYQ